MAMHEIICPHCGKAFKIDEAGYADILKQVRDGEFHRQLHERLELAEQDKRNAVELAQTKAASESQRDAAAKDAEIQELKAKLDAVESAQKLAVVEARRAGATVAELSRGLEHYRGGQTGLVRLTWDNGDRTVLVNAELGAVTLGSDLTHTAQDELFAAIEGTAFHTRVIFERMAEHGVEIRRVINGGGIPQKNETLNRVYANVLNKPVLVPEGDV